MIGRKAGIIK
jgi:hypothetical protein